MPEQLNTTNIPSNRVEFIDSRTGLVSREWYRFFLNLFTLAGNGGNQTSLDDLQIGPPPQPVSESGGGAGTVTSVGMSVPTGLSVAGSPITSSGTFAVTYTAGYSLPTTAKQTEWDTAYTDRLKWDGGATDLVAATGRTSLGATTVGGNFFTLPDPSAITFVQINADNTITTMDAPTFRTAIGAGTGAGSVTSVGTAGTVNGLTLTGGPITSSGTITLGGTLDLSSPPAIGGTTPAAGTFTTLGVTTSINASGAGSNVNLPLVPKGTGIVSVIPSAGWVTGQVAEIDLGDNNAVLKATYATGQTALSAYNTLNFATRSTLTTQMAVTHTASAVNYVQVTGAATTKATVVSSAGSDSNISSVFQSKGTGAIDLAAGSSGVNISNGGTVTAITRTAGGSSYTSATTPAITAPTTAGGVQATATANMGMNASPTVTAGGTGYTLNDILTVSGGTYTSQAQLKVTAVSGGVITAVTVVNSVGSYTVIPTSPFSVTGGTGSSATFTLTNWSVQSLNITNAGSGYVEQPTVSFSGGGGSGAAAYARVGGVVSLNSLGSTLNLGTEAGTGFRVLTAGATAIDMWQAISNGTTAILRSSNATSNGQVQTSGTGGVQLGTNGGVTQCLVAHTASAVNYVQVTGAVTSGTAIISAQGSDASIPLQLRSKGTFNIGLANGSGNQGFVVSPTGSANYLQATSSNATVAPSLAAAGSDTNIDLTLTPKGTGVVRTSGTGIRLYGSSSGYVGLTGAAAAGSTTYTLPAADGSTGQMLSTNGSGTLSWATGGGSNITAQGLWENNTTISSNYSVTSGNNALSAGPITVASGVVVTVPSGSVWTIV